MRTEIWECENCGARSIDGCGAAWTTQDDERFHACPRLTPRLSPRPASRVELDCIVTEIEGLKLRIEALEKASR